MFMSEPIRSITMKSHACLIFKDHPMTNMTFMHGSKINMSGCEDFLHVGVKPLSHGFHQMCFQVHIGLRGFRHLSCFCLLPLGCNNGRISHSPESDEVSRSESWNRIEILSLTSCISDASVQAKWQNVTWLVRPYPGGGGWYVTGMGFRGASHRKMPACTLVPGYGRTSQVTKRHLACTPKSMRYVAQQKVDHRVSYLGTAVQSLWQILSWPSRLVARFAKMNWLKHIGKMMKTKLLSPPQRFFFGLFLGLLVRGSCLEAWHV